MAHSVLDIQVTRNSKTSKAMLRFKPHLHELPPIHVLVMVSQRHSSKMLPASLTEALKKEKTPTKL